VRNETTVGKALKASSLMPHWVAALLALGAVVTIEGDEGVEDVGLDALMQRQVKGDVKTLHVPRLPETGWGEAHVARTPSDDPIVSAMAVVRASDGVIQEARVALTGVGPGPVWLADAPEALLGQALDEGRIGEVASGVEDEVQPQGDYLGSERYRRAMAGVLTRRALETCAASLTAGGGQ
jgi:carbon-monoxide dehydrogenase medium subunit